ncbi:MAG TPA: SusE domain-containing protein [Parafilimonas sp.]|nr:SusE domain-containing protein [Parafilimonas sp.]
MKKNMKGLLIILAGIFLLHACDKIDKVDVLPAYANAGNAPVLSSDVATVNPKPADSGNAVITFTWTNPMYATDSSTVKYILEIDSSATAVDGTFKRELTGVRTTSLTGKELNSILLNWGLALGGSHTLSAKVVSSYANHNQQYTSNVMNIAVTPYGDSSTLTASATDVSCALATADQHAIDFTWSSSFNGYSGVVTYTLQYDSAGRNFASPKEIPVGASMYIKSLTQGELNETAINSGVIGGTSGKVDYRIKAATALGALVYSNLVSVTIQSYQSTLRFYMPGGYQAATGNGNDWDPGTAPELIRDLRTGLLNNMYYTYIWLPANAEFKVTQGRSWDINYGGANGNLVKNGDNFKVDHDGVYRISIDRNAMKYDIQDGRMGFVGGAVGAGWEPGNTFPNYAMGNAATNLFVGITDFAADGWKLIDNNHWNDGSNTVGETRSYGSEGGDGSTMLVNGPNFPNIATAGKYRVIWDGRDVDNIKYFMSPATEMRLVGDGISGVNAWDPGASPQMTYKGSGVWEITVDLIGGKDIKFLAGNAWGALDYEDNSGGSTAVGTPRKIKWEGGDNFKTPAASGTYKITLNEYSQTMTISQ